MSYLFIQIIPQINGGVYNIKRYRYYIEMNQTMAVILAAGKGTRLKSDIPKVLHNINNKPMVHCVIDSCLNASISNICLVVGYKKEVYIKLHFTL